MSFVCIDVKNRMPIYEQLVENISKMVLSGVFLPNEPIPSVRQLASELGINPNTIQKAYSELERRGIIYSVKGRGSFVSDSIGDALKRQKETVIAELKSAMKEAKALGLNKADIDSIADTVWYQ